MALVTTFATTPLTSALFPPWYQKKLAAWKRGEIEWDGDHLEPAGSSGDEAPFSSEKDQSGEIRKLLVCLRLDSLPSIFTFVALLGGAKSEAATAAPKSHPTKNGNVTASNVDHIPVMAKRPLEVHGVRMLDLTDRLSSAMKEVESDEYSIRDPVVNAFHTFGQLHNVAVSGEVQLVPEGAYSDLLSDRACERRSDMILLPWSETGDLSEAIMTNMIDKTSNAFGNSTYNQFVSQLLDHTPCNAAILVNNGFGALPRNEPGSLSRVPTTRSLPGSLVPATAPIMDPNHHIFFPFIGGDDDRVALRFVLRLAKNPNVTATIIQVATSGTLVETADVIQTESPKTNTRIASSIKNTSYDQERSFFTSMADSLAAELQSRVSFRTINSVQPLSDALDSAKAEVGLSPKNAGDLVIVGRNHGKISNGQYTSSGQEDEIRACLGAVAETMISGRVQASVLVIQAGRKGL